ncbi:MAG: hypothetical protein V1752_04265 [Candidatus Firestonebacteria bacterium]
MKINWFVYVLVISLITTGLVYYVHYRAKAAILNKIYESEKLVREAKINVEKGRALINNAKNIYKNLSGVKSAQNTAALQPNPNSSEMLDFRTFYGK